MSDPSRRCSDARRRAGAVRVGSARVCPAAARSAESDQAEAGPGGAPPAEAGPAAWRLVAGTLLSLRSTPGKWAAAVTAPGSAAAWKPGIRWVAAGVLACGWPWDPSGYALAAGA